MPDNQNSVMVVLDFPGGAVPAGWTEFPNDNLIARRVAYADYRKLFINTRKVVAIKVYRENPGGSAPFEDEFSGNDDYAMEHDVVNGQLLVCKHNVSGSGAGTTRVAFKETTNGGVNSEFWDKERGQVPMLGLAMQDSSPGASQLAVAQALDTDDVALG